MTGEEDASDGTPRRATRDERPRDDDHPRPARAAERGGPADGGGAPRRVPRLRPGPDRARRRALGRRWDVLRGLRSQGLCRGPAETRSRVRRGMGPTRMRLGKPVIAAVSGHAVAGGFELALWCDLRVVEEDAILGVFNRRWGVPLVDGGTVRLPAVVGFGRALDLILTGRPVDAREAERIGLANRVVAKGKAREEAQALALRLAALPPHSVKSDRQSAYDALGVRLGAALRREHALGMRSAATGESLEGASRFAAGAGRHGSFA